MDSFGGDQKPKISFVLLRGSESGGDGFRVGKVLLLFRVKSKNNYTTTEEELAFVQHMDCTELMDETDEVLRYVCLRWSTSGKVDYSKMREEEDEMWRLV